MRTQEREKKIKCVDSQSVCHSISMDLLVFAREEMRTREKEGERCREKGAKTGEKFQDSSFQFITYGVQNLQFSSIFFPV